MLSACTIPQTGPLRRPIVRQPKAAYNLPRRSLLAKDTPVTDRIAVLKQTTFFAELSAEELQSLAHDFVTREFRQGELIFYQGDTGRVLYLIAEGRVRIYVQMQNEEGQEKSVILYGPGDVFGDMAVIDDRPRSANAVAVTDTTVLLLSRENLHKHLRRSNQLALNFIQVLSNRLRYNTEQFYDVYLDVPGRLARRLLELAERHGQPEGEGIRINFPLTQSDLAYLVGTTRESVNKSLGTFRKQGFIRMQQNYVVILDAKALQKISM